MKVLIFIPAYNEEASIKNVVLDIQKNCPQADYVVINDGSSDGTQRVCEENGFPCITHPVNLGLDGVFQTGVRYAKRHNYDICMPFDGDGQHNAVYINKMLEKMQEGNYDFVIGSRFLENKKPNTLRMAGSRLLSACFKATTGKIFTDPTSGMRMCNKRTINVLCKDFNLGPEPDTWAYLVRNGAKFCEVQVKMNERETGTSYFTLGRSMIFMARMCISILFIQWFRLNNLYGKEK